MILFSQWFLVIFIILTYLDDGSASPSSALYFCVDKDCKEWVSQGKTLLKYNATTAKHLSFNADEDVLIVGKPVDKDDPDWIGKIRNQIGLVPKNMVREDRMSQIPLDFKNAFHNISNVFNQEEVDEKTPTEKMITQNGDFSYAQAEFEMKAETIGEEMYLWTSWAVMEVIEHFGGKLRFLVCESLWDTFVHMQRWMQFTMVWLGALFIFYMYRLTALDDLEAENIRLGHEIETANLLVDKTINDANALKACLDDELKKREDELKKREDELKNRENELKEREDELKEREEELRKEKIYRKKHEDELEKANLLLNQKVKKYQYEIQFLKTRKQRVEHDRAILCTRLEVHTCQLDKLLRNTPEPEPINIFRNN